MCMFTIFTPSIQSITGDTTSAALGQSAATEDRDGQAEPMKLMDQENQASIISIISITNTTRSGSTTRRSGSTIEIGMMMMIEIEIETEIKIKIARQG